MVTRRAVLGGALGVGALGTTALTGTAIAMSDAVPDPAAGPVRNPGPAAARLPLTVVNHTGQFADKEISVSIVGTDLASGQQAYVSRGAGALARVNHGLNGPAGSADLSVPLDPGGSLTLDLPRMSGRIYITVGGRLRFPVVTDGNGRPAFQHPAGWVATDPSFGLLHDFVEFTFNEAGLFCNTTMVDMFSIPLAITLTGKRTQTTGTLVDGGRAGIFAAIAALPGYRSLIVGDGLRVIAPGHALDAKLFPTGYFDGYVDQVWATYARTDLLVRTNTGTFTGRVTGDRLVFDGGVRPFARPSTRDILYCDGALAAPNDGITGPVAAALGAAFNRATLCDGAIQPTVDATAFYRHPVANHYARVMHEHTVDAKAYGFAFDDVADFASFIHDPAPARLTVTLTPFDS